MNPTLSESGWMMETCPPLNGHGFGHASDHESVNGHENVNAIFAFYFYVDAIEVAAHTRLEKTSRLNQ